MKTVSIIVIAAMFTASVVPWAVGAEPKKPAAKEKPKDPNAFDGVGHSIGRFEKYWKITLSPAQKTRFREALGPLEEHSKRQEAQAKYALSKDAENRAIYERRLTAMRAGDEKGIMQAIVDERKLRDAGPEGVMRGKFRAILTEAQQKVMDDKIADDEKKEVAATMKAISDAKKKAK